MMQWQEFFDGKTFLPGGSSSGPDGAGRLTEGDMYRKRGKRKSGILRGAAALALAAAMIFTGILLWVEVIIEPNLEAVSRMRAEVLVSRAVNKALTEQFGKEDPQKDFFIVQKDEDGRTEMVQADSIAINVMMTELTGCLQQAFREMDEETLEVPVGSLFGSKLFSQTGPYMDLAVVPLSVLSTDFRTEFEEQAINQTKYKIYIVLSCRVKVMAPFCSRTFDTSTTVLLAETVILGEVPDSFVQVPEEDILDVT